MEPKINPQNYENMIAALTAFKNDIQNIYNQIAAAISTCQEAVGENDYAFPTLEEYKTAISQQIKGCKEQAQDIINSMQTELNTDNEHRDEFTNDGF